MRPRIEGCGLRLAVACLAAAWCLGAAPAGAADVPRPPSLSDRLRLLPRAPLAGLQVRPMPLAGQDDFDVLDYDLSLTLDTAGKKIVGTAVITFQAAPGVAQVDELVVNLDDALDVRVDVTLRGSTRWLAHTRNQDELRVSLVPPVPAGQVAALTIHYSGKPRQSGVGLQFSSHGVFPRYASVYSLSEPYGARLWWPCKDRPDDKATVTMRVEASSALTVVSNGTLVQRRPASSDGRSVTTWRESNPISTYLVSLAIGRYSDTPGQPTWSVPYVSQGGDPSRVMTMDFWSFTDRATRVHADWDVAPEMMGYFERSFGPYPFLSEKYGHAMIEPVPGLEPFVAMENQTASSFGVAWVSGAGRNEWLIAHEMSHQWFGDSVGLQSFPSLWLNEGFATYSEALWTESRGSLDDYLGYMRSLDPLQQNGTDFEGTVDAPADANGDGWPDGDSSGPVLTVYDKGAWVLHMLRWLVGAAVAAPSQESILTIMRHHADAHAHGSSTSAEFEAMTGDVVADELGRSVDLAPFFDQWLRRASRPCYAIGHIARPSPGGGYDVLVEVEQRELVEDGDTSSLRCGVPVTEPWVMPVQLTIHGTDGSLTDMVVPNGEVRQHYTRHVASEPATVGWDEAGWILKKVEVVNIDADGDGWADDLDGCPTVPNPDQEDRDGVGGQDACQVGLDYDGDGAPNESDCAPADAGVHTSPDARLRPELDPALRVGRELSGDLVLAWTVPAPPAGERSYTSDVTEGRLDRLRANMSLRDGTCLDAGLTSERRVVPAAVATGNRWFLVTGWNGCGPVDAAGHPIGACR